MPMTPNGGASSYCDAPTLLLLYDPELIGQYVRNDGLTATPDELLTDPTLAFMLRSASGDLEIACTKGGRYTAADLAALGSSNGGAFLANLVGALAFGKLRRKRGFRIEDYPEVVAAEKTLEELKTGEAALPFAEVAAAGLAVTENYTPSDFAHLHRPSDTAKRFFGNRSPGGYEAFCDTRWT